VSYRARDVITRAAGAADGRDAMTRCRSEGLPAGTVCFLDLHDLEASRCVEYTRGWVGTLVDARVMRPGICCAGADAAVLGAATRGEHPLWVVGATAHAAADIVEFPVRVMGEVHADVGLHVRHCLARAPDPSRPAGASVREVRQLIDGCLGAFSRAAFPRGIASVEMDVTAHDGTTTARLRITGSRDASE